MRIMALLLLASACFGLEGIEAKFENAVQAVKAFNAAISTHKGCQLEYRGTDYLLIKRDENNNLNDLLSIDDLSGKLAKGQECVIFLSQTTLSKTGYRQFHSKIDTARKQDNLEES